jgi:septal ring factor EnvC (AmiA/AmiB activator)
MPRRILMCLALTATVAAGSCTNPRVQANIAQALNDVGSELTAQRQDMALLQDQVDSLKHAMAHQDSTIKRLLTAAGLPEVQP